ncbi:hypothetical protein CF319_g1309 [Tilletia indica]|nr:hypothetical protein CF319_g1309 [Tilletia indica]
MAPGGSRLPATRMLGERVFESEPLSFQLLESELDAFLAEERRYCSFKAPVNPNKARKSRKKENARRYNASQSSSIFEATYVSRCSCSGTYQPGSKDSVSPKKRRITGGAASSVKTNCPAKIKITIRAPLLEVTMPSPGPGVGLVLESSQEHLENAAAASETSDAADLPQHLSVLSGPPRQDSLLDIEYHWRHEGHAVGSISDLARQRNPTEVKDWIEDQVRGGKTAKEIMASVRMDMDELSVIHSMNKSELSSSITSVNASIRIRYHDVYNTVRRLKLKTARKDPDTLRSLQLWAETLREEGWQADFLNDRSLSATPEPVWAIFVMPKWAKKRAETEAQFEAARTTFFSRWSEHQPLITKYFEKEWLNKRSAQNWAKCHRQHAHFGIDTNNMVEGWHGNLKVNYLGMIRLQRVDSVLQILVREVVPDFYRRLVQCDIGIQKPNLCGQERKSRLKAHELSFQELCALVKCVYGEAYEVTSTDGERLHVVDAKLSQCSCPSFQSTGLACKHLFMCSRLLAQPIARLQKPGTHTDTSTISSTAVPPTVTGSSDEGGEGRSGEIRREAEGSGTEGEEKAGEEGNRTVILGQSLEAQRAAELEAEHQQQKEDLVQTSISEAHRLLKALNRLQEDRNLAELSRTALEQLDNEVRAARRTAEMVALQTLYRHLHFDADDFRLHQCIAALAQNPEVAAIPRSICILPPRGHYTSTGMLIYERRTVDRLLSLATNVQYIQTRFIQTPPSASDVPTHPHLRTMIVTGRAADAETIPVGMKGVSVRNYTGSDRGAADAAVVLATWNDHAPSLRTVIFDEKDRDCVCPRQRLCRELDSWEGEGPYQFYVIGTFELEIELGLF